MESARHGRLSRSVRRRRNIHPTLSRPRRRDRPLRSSLRRLPRRFRRLGDRPSRDRDSNLYRSDPLVRSHRAADRRWCARGLLLRHARRYRRPKHRRPRAQNLFQEYGAREERFPVRGLQGRESEARAQIIGIYAPERSAEGRFEGTFCLAP